QPDPGAVLGGLLDRVLDLHAERPRDRVGDVREQAALQPRVVEQDVAGDAGRQQQQGEQRQETEVGDRRRVLVAVVPGQPAVGVDDVPQPEVAALQRRYLW